MRRSWDTLDDAELLAAARDERPAFAAFYRRHARAVLAFFARRTRDPELAADLTAETFAAALEGCTRFDPARGEPAAWLYGIAWHKLLAAQRHGRAEDAARRRLGMARVELGDAAAAAIDALGRDEPRLAGALAALPAEQRAAVRDRVVRERSYEEIAAEQTVSQAAVRQRVSRGLAALRQLLGKEAV